MPTDARYSVPFLPQTGVSEQILAALQLANEQSFRRQQLAQQQQRLGMEQQTAQAQIEELRARTGLYGTEAQKNQLEIDQRRRFQQMFGGGAQSGQTTPAQPTAPQPATSISQWLPQGTPPNLAPIVGAMLPQNLSDEERPLIESAAAAGNAKAAMGDYQGYFTSLQSGITDVSNRRLQLRNQPENQPVTDSDRKNFNENILPSLENLSDAQKKLATSAAAGAKNQRDFRDVRDQFMRLDGQALTAKIAQANRVSNENLRHNLQLDKDGRDKIIAANTKWADAQTQLNVGLESIQQAADGNDLMTRMVPTMEVLGINMTGGIRRISPTEYQAAEIPASWANRFNSWVDRVTQGKTTPEMVNEGKQLFATLADARYSTYLAEQKSTAANYKMDSKDVSVIDNSGQSVSLDKALKGGVKPATKAAAPPQPQVNAPPPGATMKVPGSDGKLHWSDGKSDLGVVNE